MLQVTWEPYGSGERFGYTPDFVLNPKCTEERNLWLMSCPLICHWAVEHHMPQRVMRQFGLFQDSPPEFKYTDRELHRLDIMICVSNCIFIVALLFLIVCLS